MAEIARTVYRNSKGGALGLAVAALVSVAVAAGIAYATDAPAEGWVCAGGGALLVVVLFAADRAAFVFDRRPKLVIDAEGIQDLRTRPPVRYAWDDYKKVFVDLRADNTGDSSGGKVIALELVARSGEPRNVTIPVADLNAPPAEIAAAIEEIWEQVKEARGTGDEPNEADEVEKPELAEVKQKPKPWQKGRADRDEADDTARDWER